MAAGIPEFAVRKSLAVRERHSESFQPGAPARRARSPRARTPARRSIPTARSVPELELMVKGGLTPLAAIASATSTAARARSRGETGRIAPGLAADLLAVAGNPAERIQALDDVRLVLRRRVALASIGWASGADAVAALASPRFLQIAELAPLVALQSCATGAAAGHRAVADRVRPGELRGGPPTRRWSGIG